ncbi:hypothetical protein HMPREF0294_0575 [Corynebacterium glucuronolyticum ATCC 51867]|nr:hypothetical protein HMPREF0294_0575 [Corynebacterium glucuronolyticum ATCC 51867]
MGLIGTVTCQKGGDLPRTCGDEPDPRATARWQLESAPHLRG